VIYSGTFGRGLFQTLYQPPGNMLQYLPLTFEWTALSLPLALTGIIAGGAGLFLTLPLLLTWVMCLKGGWSAKIDPRFEGPKARGLIALLIYLGPLLRGWSRIKWRLKALPRMTTETRPFAQRANVAWRARGLTLAFWNEAGTEKEAVLGALMRACAAEKHPVAMENGWSDWDVEIGGGLAGNARVLVVGENHGADKRLLRARWRLRPSMLVRAAVGGAGALALASLLFGGVIAAVVFAGLAVALGAAALWQLSLFARRLHGLVEDAARETGLVPVAPLARAPLPIGPAKTAEA
jgi:O-antigen biosynthesis protein